MYFARFVLWFFAVLRKTCDLKEENQFLTTVHLFIELCSMAHAFLLQNACHVARWWPSTAITITYTYINDENTSIAAAMDVRGMYDMRWHDRISWELLRNKTEVFSMAGVVCRSADATSHFVLLLGRSSIRNVWPHDDSQARKYTARSFLSVSVDLIEMCISSVRFAICVLLVALQRI